MVAKLRGGICILSRYSHLVGSSEGGFLAGSKGACFWLRDSGAAFASWDAVFRFRVLGWEAQRAIFFKFRGRLVVFDELRGGILRSRGRSVVVAELKGDICILGRRFQVQIPWLGSSDSGIFQV